MKIKKVRGKFVRLRVTFWSLPLLAVCAGLLLTFAVPAIGYASVIVFAPQTDEIQVAQTLRVDVSIQDFLPEVDPVIGDFDVYVKFDDSLLFSRIEDLPYGSFFGAFLGSPGDETTAAFGVDSDNTPNVVMVMEGMDLDCRHLLAAA